MVKFDVDFPNHHAGSQFSSVHNGLEPATDSQPGQSIDERRHAADAAKHDDAAPKPIQKETFTATLNNHEYTANPYDPCIFNTVDEEENQCTIFLYVDDLFVTCKRHGMIETTITEHLGVERSRTDTRKYRKSSNPKRSYKAAITFAASDGMNEARSGVS